MALAATVYLSALGKDGFREVAAQNLLKAHYAFDQLIQLPRVGVLFSSPFFNEFALEVPLDPEILHRRLLTSGFIGGFPLKHWEPRLTRGWLVCVTEARSKEEIDRFVEAVDKELKD